MFFISIHNIINYGQNRKIRTVEYLHPILDVGWAMPLKVVGRVGNAF